MYKPRCKGFSPADGDGLGTGKKLNCLGKGEKEQLRIRSKVRNCDLI